MQVNTNNIQRPTLIEPFLNEELTPDNEFLIYIDCNTNSSNIVHKNSSVTSDSHNSKKSLNLGNNKHSNLIKIGKQIKKTLRELRELELDGTRNYLVRADLRALNDLRVAVRAS